VTPSLVAFIANHCTFRLVGSAGFLQQIDEGAHLGGGEVAELARVAIADIIGQFRERETPAVVILIITVRRLSAGRCARPACAREACPAGA
jgi:hypothetical protein